MPLGASPAAGRTYLVTGAAGFIGAEVSRLLLDRGDRVYGLDNLNDAYDVRLKRWRLNCLEAHPGFTFAQLDVSEMPPLQRVFEKFPTPLAGVINLAARAGVRQSVENPAVYVQTNTNGTLNLLEACRQFGVPKFILASTSSLYGESTAQPFREDAPTDRPLSPYAASKKAAEALCYAYHRLHNLDVTIFRYFTVYGPAGRPDMSLFRFVQRIAENRVITVFGDGAQSRDFTYVTDVARGTIAGLRSLGYEIVNLGSDRPVVLNEALHMIEQMLGEDAQIRHESRHPADVPATWADITKARTMLDWEPQVTLEEGLAALVAWYRENRAWASDVKTD